MKKVLLSLFLSVFLYGFSYSQTIINSFANQFGEWSDYYDTWSWENIKYANISFMLQNNVIIVNDNAKSTYTTLELVYEDGVTYQWDAIDERGRYCSFMMSVVNGYNCIIIVYSDICYRYYYN